MDSQDVREGDYGFEARGHVSGLDAAQKAGTDPRLPRNRDECQSTVFTNSPSHAADAGSNVRGGWRGVTHAQNL